MKYQLYREQQLNCSLQTAWEFFSTPNNLSKITPSDLRLTVLNDFKDEPIFQGMLISYTVSPICNIPLTWVTKITQVDKLKSFTDFQAKGPYKYWNHFHEFVENQHGVLVKDTVDYQLPFGFVGTLAHDVLVKKKLESIFDFRQVVLDQFFNK
ncbi:SRPBCC family protein [Myroides sp. LJL119]